MSKFFRFIVLLFILICISDLLIQTSWSSEHELPDEFSTHSTSVKNVEIDDRLSTLSTDLIPIIFNYLDDEALSRMTWVSKTYKKFEEFTESIFQQRSAFEKILPLTFPKKSSSKHSYFLRKRFWDLLINYRDHYHQYINDDERKNLGKFAQYCATYNFIVSDLVYFIIKIIPLDFKYNLLSESELKGQSVNSEDALNHLKQFNQNLTEAISNQNLVGLEVGVILSVLGISPNMLNSDTEKFFYLMPGPLEDDFSINCYEILYQKHPALFKFIIGKSTLNIEKAVFIYDLVEGKCENYKTALDFYRRATKDNCKVAKYNIGLIYEMGLGVIKDYNKAFAWFLKAANQGNVFAQYSLGYMYLNGQGVMKNDTEAFFWSFKAADQGHALAQKNIGWMYLHGQGVTQDYKKALDFFSQSSKSR